MIRIHTSSVRSFVLLGVLFILAASCVDFGSAQPSSLLSNDYNDQGNDAGWSNSNAVNDGTVRIDPLDGFKKYRGGFDITGKNYWSSTAFTGVYGYAMAALCLLAGICYGVFKLVAFLCCCKNRARKKKMSKEGSFKSLPPDHYRDYVIHKRFVVLFLLALVATMVASGVALAGSAGFNNKAKKTLDVVVHTANNASGTIYDVTSAMAGISRSLQETAEATSQFPAASEASQFLRSTSRRLESEAANIERKAMENRRLIDLAVTIVYVLSVVAISLNLVVAIAISAFGILRIRKSIHWLFALCWSLIVLCWLLFGIYYFLHNFAKDTCHALEGFEQNPETSSLSSLVPCGDLAAAARPTLGRVSEGIYDLVSQLNVAAVNLSATLGIPANYVQICSPFSSPPHYQYRPLDDFNCPPPAVAIGDIPKVVKLVTCSDDGACGDGQFVSAADYRLVEGYASSIQGLVDAFPGLQSLVECESVKESLSPIVGRHCKPLKRNAMMTWAALIPVAVLSMLILVLVLVMQGMGLLTTDGSVRSVAKDDSSSSELAGGSGDGRQLV